jgi:hypothetical protein
MKNKLFFVIALVAFIGLNSCISKRCSYGNFLWLYRDISDRKQEFAGATCKYFIWVEDDSIFVQSKSNSKCVVLNDKGIVIDSTYFNDSRVNPSWIEIDSEKTHLWDTWRYKIPLKDTSKVSYMEFVSRPLGSGSLLSRKDPDRERSIKIIYNERNYSFVLPVRNGPQNVFDICQYDSTHFVISLRCIYDKARNATGNCVVMIDVEDFTRRHFLGIKF